MTMKNIFKSGKAQSITEFVIIVPVLLLLFVGTYQFALLMVSQIKIAMVEREIMRFVTDEADHNGDYKEFGKEMAGKIGLDPEKINIYESKPGDAGPGKSNDMSFCGINMLNNFVGLTFVTEYSQDLLPFFASITGKGAVKLRTRLTTAAGGSFAVRLKDAGDALGRIFGQGRDPESVYGTKESQWKQQNMPRQGENTQPQ
jgi:hypothetical protein